MLLRDDRGLAEPDGLLELELESETEGEGRAVLLSDGVAVPVPVELGEGLFADVPVVRML